MHQATHHVRLTYELKCWFCQLSKLNSILFFLCVYSKMILVQTSEANMSALWLICVCVACKWVNSPTKTYDSQCYDFVGFKLHHAMPAFFAQFSRYVHIFFFCASNFLFFVALLFCSILFVGRFFLIHIHIFKCVCLMCMHVCMRAFEYRWLTILTSKQPHYVDVNNKQMYW